MLAIVIQISFVLYSIGFLLILIRLATGPSLADRVVSLDMMALNAVGFISIFAISTDESVYFRVAISLALISILGTVAFAYYIGKRGRK